jgi:MFS family permease
MRPEELVPVDRGDERPTLLGGIREGLSYAIHSPRVRVVLLLVTVVSTVGFNFHVILPLLASDTLDAGPEVFGLLSAAFGGGALVGALFGAALGRASWKILLAGMTGFSVSLLALAPVRNALLAAALLFVTGLCFTLWTSDANSILQLSAPDALRGRVVSLFLFAFAGFAPIGGLLAGWLVDVGGTELSFAVSGLTGLLAAAYAARLGGFSAASRPEPVLQGPNTQSTTP